MRMYDLIENKKRGHALTKDEIDWVVKGYTAGSIPDYQMSALLMAIYFQKMNIEETANLTLAMAHSGDTLNLEGIHGIKVDKHSTGGVGDKTTLIVAPLVAAAGVPVAKMSGRGLGHTGGTIDKLEAFPGFHTEIPMEQFIHNVNTYGITVAAQSGNLAPADKKIYALRDVTATVDNLSLIASSIMSKKIASGADAIVLDVKCGNGAFMKTPEAAKELGERMVEIGKSVGRRTMAVVTNMSEPLGRAVGNSLEVKEAIEVLQGSGPADITELSILLASYMLVLGQKADSLEAARGIIEGLIQSGEGLTKLEEWVKAQNGDGSAVRDTSLLPGAKYQLEVCSQVDGYVCSIETEQIGKAALALGAGRENKESQIDLGAGLLIHKKIGDQVTKGESIATLYANQQALLQVAEQIVQQAYSIEPSRVQALPTVYCVIQ